MDVAIVGGGVSGCYCAYRLALAHPEWTVNLYEASDRIGGRLWSVDIAGYEASPAEMGGMFIGNKHHNLWSLVHDHLKLPTFQVDSSDTHQYLRGAFLKDQEYTNPPPAKFPYKLWEKEKGKFPKRLLVYALTKIIPQFGLIWPAKQDASPAHTYDILRTFQLPDGRLLRECGFWNVLSEYVSYEAYDLLLSTIGISSIVRNANAVESIWTLLRNFHQGQTYHQIRGGYQQLPLTLVKRAKEIVTEKGQPDNFNKHLSHTVTKVSHDGCEFVFSVASPNGVNTARAKKVILALPRLALQRMNFDQTVIANAEEFDHDLSAVICTPGSRVYLTFEKAWWNDSENAIWSDATAESETAFWAEANVACAKAPEPEFGTKKVPVAAAYTDLPLQTCHYFGMPKGGGPVMMMGASTDDVSTSFWQGLMCDPRPFPNAAVSTANKTATACTKSLVESACDQLSEMHEKADATPPLGAVFVDWCKPPHGAAWHEWAPGRQSWIVGPRIRQPNPDRELFICGEAYSQRQGWVEGAITTAEMVLTRMGLDTADWLKTSELHMDVEGEPVMKNRLLELVVALSESLALQRAYIRDREAIMNAFGLSDDEKSALKSNNPDAVKAASGGTIGVFNSIISIVLGCD